jgi:hypothetical protein
MPESKQRWMTSQELKQPRRRKNSEGKSIARRCAAMLRRWKLGDEAARRLDMSPLCGLKILSLLADFAYGRWEVEYGIWDMEYGIWDMGY